MESQGSSGFAFPGEYNFNLAEYMVLLDKPVGLTLAPEPHSGRILVQKVHKGSPASSSRLIQVGDWLKACSAVFGEEMWDCTDVQRTRWAISNRAGKVKLVFERGGGGAPPLWYFVGKLGLASMDATEGQCILRFDGEGGGAGVDTCIGDRAQCMWVAFNRCSDTAVKPAPSLPAGKRARFARIDETRRQLAEATSAPDIVLSPPLQRAGGGAAAAGAGPLRFQVCGPGTANVPLPLSSQNGAVPFRRPASPSGSPRRREAGPAGAGAPPVPAGGAGATPAAPAAGKPAKRVRQLLPWLMLTSSRLSASDLTRLASQRALGALLEYEVGSDADGAVVLRRTAVGGGHAGGGGGAVAPGGSVAPAPAATAPVAVTPSVEAGNSGSANFLGAAEASPGGFGASSAQPIRGTAAAAAVGPQVETAPGAAAESTCSKVGEGGEAPTAGGSGGSSSTTSSSSDGGNGIGGGSSSGSLTVINGSDGAGDGGLTGPPGTTAEDALVMAVAGSSNNSSRGGSGGGSSSSSGGGGGGSAGVFIPNWPATSIGNGRAAVQTQVPPVLSQAQALAAGPIQAPAVAAEPGPAAGSEPAEALEWARSEALALAAAQLQRLAVRRLSGHVRTGDTQLLLHYPEGEEGGATTLLAGWLLWHKGLDLDEAMGAAEAAMGAPADKELLLATSEHLVARARARFSRIVLIWPYGGMSADVSGELVGGWGQRVPMRRCMSPAGCRGAARGQFLVELQGLVPGRYHYKFIIDNTWAVDPFAPKDLDGSGNWNNVCEVRAPPKIETPQERRHFAALQATMMAFEAKMGTGSGVRAGRARRG